MCMTNEAGRNRHSETSLLPCGHLPPASSLKARGRRSRCPQGALDRQGSVAEGEPLICRMGLRGKQFGLRRILQAARIPDVVRQHARRLTAALSPTSRMAAFAGGRTGHSHGHRDRRSHGAMPQLLSRHQPNSQTSRPCDQGLAISGCALAVLLERLLQPHRDHSAEEALEDVARTRKTTAGSNLVRVG